MMLPLSSWWTATYSVLFLINAFTTDQAEPIPFYIFTQGDLAKLIWQHPKYLQVHVGSACLNLAFMIGIGILAIGLGTVIITKTASIGELLMTFLPTAFFLSSVCIFLSVLSSIPHIPTMAVGVIWLFSIMSMSLLRFRPIQYLYLFIRFAGVDSSIWILNKLVLLVVGIVLWICVFLVCQKRLWVK